MILIYFIFPENKQMIEFNFRHQLIHVHQETIGTIREVYQLPIGITYYI